MAPAWDLVWRSLVLCIIRQLTERGGNGLRAGWSLPCSGESRWHRASQKEELQSNPGGTNLRYLSCRPFLIVSAHPWCNAGQCPSRPPPPHPFHSQKSSWSWIWCPGWRAFRRRCPRRWRTWGWRCYKVRSSWAKEKMGMGNENLPRRVEGCIEGHNEGNIQDCHQDNHVPDLKFRFGLSWARDKEWKRILGWGGVGIILASLPWETGHCNQLEICRLILILFTCLKLP